MKPCVFKLLSLLLVLALLLGAVPALALSGAEGAPPAETTVELTAAEAEEPPAWDAVEPELTEVPPAEPDPYWVEIAVFEAERLPDEPTRADYAALVPEVAALVETLPGYVTDSISYSDDGFFWRMEDRGTYGYFPEERVWSAPSDLSEPVGGQIAVYDFSGGAAWEPVAELMDDTNTTANPNVAVFEPQIGFDELFDDGHPLEAIGLKIAAYTGGTCTFYVGTAVTVDTFANAVAECGVVLIHTHGRSSVFRNEALGENVGTSYISLHNTEGLTSEDKKVLWRDPNDSDNWYSHAYTSGATKCGIDGAAIVNHMGGRTSPNGLVWLAACQTFKTDGLAAPLRAQGVGVVYGNTRSISHTSGNIGNYTSFFRHMLEGMTVAEAAWEMKKDNGYWDYAYFSDLDEENFSTYSRYQDHRSGGWVYLVKVFLRYARNGMTWEQYTDFYEDSLTEAVRYVRGYDDDGMAFPLFASADERPYPGIAWNGLQDVYSDWTLPKRNNWYSIRDTVYVQAKTYRYIGLKLRCYEGTVVDSVRLVKNELPDGMHYASRTELTLKNPCVYGMAKTPGLYEPIFGVVYRNSAGKRWMEYYTLHIIVFEKDAVVSETEQTVERALDGKSLRIRLETGYVSNYSVELLQGTLPEGMRLEWEQNSTDAYLVGRPSETGTFQATFQIIDYLGRFSNHRLTLKLTPKNGRVEETEQTVNLSNGYNSIELADGDGVYSFHGCYAIREVSGALPAGLSLRFTASDEVPLLVGKPSDIHDAQSCSVTLLAYLSDGTVVNHKVTMHLPSVLHFDLNGHGYGRPADQWVVYGQETVEPAAPVAEYGYTFVGWYMSKSQADAHNEGWRINFGASFVGVPVRELTVFAGWARTCSVRFYGYSEPGRYGTMTVQVAEGEAVTEPRAPAREEQTFLGWYTDIDCVTPYDFSAPVTENITLYPKFRPWLKSLNLYLAQDYAAPGAEVATSLSFEPWYATPDVTWLVFSNLAWVDEDGVIHISEDAEPGTEIMIGATSDGLRAFRTLTVQDIYGLRLCALGQYETEVRSDNAADVFGDGVFSFDPDTNTLTIHGDDVLLEEVMIENYGVNGLNIRVEGEVRILSEYPAVLRLSADTTLLGGGSLTILAEEGVTPDCAIEVTNGATLTLRGVSVSCTGGNLGVYGMGSDSGEARLVLQNADLEASCVHDSATMLCAAVFGFTGGIELEHCELDDSEGNYILRGGVVTAEGWPANHARFTATEGKETADVSGVIVASNGERMRRAPYRLGGRMGRTDGNGVYTMADVFLGEQTLEVYDPSGYLLTEALDVPAADPTQPESPVVLDVVPYTPFVVRFEPNGGAGGMEPREVAPGELFTLPDCGFDPPEPGVIFAGWDLGQPGDPIEITESITVTALWQADPLIHIHAPEWIAPVEPNCESAGHMGVWYCADCGRYFAEQGCELELTVSDAAELTAGSLGHDWELVEWTWADDLSEASASFICLRDESHETTLEAELTTWTLPAAGLNAGATVYHASVTLDGVEYTDECNVYDADALPQDSLMDTEGHWMTWYLDIEANALTVSGEPGGEAVIVTAFDSKQAPIGEAVSVTELNTPVSPVIPKGAAALVIEWNGYRETVDLTELVPLPGDLNGDGVYDTQDAMHLLLCAVIGGTDYALSWDEADCDFDENGVFDADDALWLLFNRVEFETSGAALVSFVLASYENGQMKRLDAISEGMAFPPEAAELLQTSLDVRLYFLGSGAAPIGGMLEIDRTTE